MGQFTTQFQERVRNEGGWIANQGPQTQALLSKAFETLYGGARGGGKTDAGMAWIAEPTTNPLYRGLVIRRNADDLSDWVSRAHLMYAGLGASFAYRPPEIRFPSGAIIRTGHLNDDDAYTKYQGHEYQRILIEELNQIPSENRYIQLLGSCRSTVDGLTPRVFATANPGGVGHSWVKARFVDAAIPGQVWTDSLTGLTRIFIPARVEDTPQLTEKDPHYVQYLESLKVTNESLYRAWRNGDWDVFAGQYFPEFRRAVHVVKSFVPKDRYSRVGGMDWGRSHPFAFLGAIVIPVTFIDRNNEKFQFTRVIIYSETYGTHKTPKEWAEVISKRVNLRRYKYIQADPAIYTKGNDGSISIADQFKAANSDFGILRPASNDRVGGWENLHQWLSIAPDGAPFLWMTDNCTNLIRCIPELVHDENKVEDVDTDAEGSDGLGNDHAPDALRYLLKSKELEGKAGILISGFSEPNVFNPEQSVDPSLFAKARPRETGWRY